MNPNPAAFAILMADDDPDDRLLTKMALSKSRLANPLLFVEDGEELLEYLQRRGAYEDPERSPQPGLILLDLNMPRKSGYEALEEIKNDPNLKRIPIVVMTTSQADEDVVKSYDLGANSYITKPITLNGLVEVMQQLGKYWFEITALPSERKD